jgi:hypothetical protein
MLRYQILSRTQVGRRYLERWGARSRENVLQRHFGGAVRDVGELRV